ncbi:MAG: AAA family ATPase [Clostridia bacterium]|nr:AAA family ATPase [Clostridia bacterium]
MIIEKIVIKSFGRITDMTLEFSDKVNVIEGENESGKSTIAAFIRYMLFGFDNENEAGLSERQRRINWKTGMASGSMYVRVGGKRYVITRSTVPTDNSERPTYREESSIIDAETGAPAFGTLSAGEVFFGVDGELFDNTAFVGQIGDSSINEDSVKESIENIIFSGSEKINKQRAAARIADKMQALYHENGTGGAIIDLAAKERSLEERLAACNKDNRMILEKETELHQIRARRADAESKQIKLYDLDSSYNNAMLIQTFDRLHVLEEEYEEMAESYKKFIEENTRAGFCPDEKYLADLVIARKSWNEAYHALGEAQDYYSSQKAAIGITHEIENAIALCDELGGEEEIVARATAFKKKEILSTVISVAAALVMLASIVFEIAAAGSDMIFGKVIFGILGFVALGAGGYYVYEMIKNNKALAALEGEFNTATFDDLKGKIAVIADARYKRDAMTAATENARLAMLRARDKYENSKRELNTLIERWGETSPESGFSEFLDDLEERARLFVEKKNELLDEKNNMEITVREIRRNLADKSEIDVRAQVSPLKRKVFSGINHDEIINGIANAKARVAEEDRLAFDVENELMLLKSRAGDPGEYYSRIDYIAARREDMQEKHKALFIALGAINSATDNLRKEISPRLGEYATRIMEIMTDKKYTSFDVSDGLKVSFTDNSGEERSIDFLSGGTKDMAYIAVRAALIDMLYPEKPPVCFDESFAHQDNVRASAMMRAIKHLADEGCQSFIFTCRGREASLASEIVDGAGVYKLS